jgi:hypothetical protein
MDNLMFSVFLTVLLSALLIAAFPPPGGAA